MEAVKNQNFELEKTKSEKIVKNADSADDNGRMSDRLSSNSSLKRRPMEGRSSHSIIKRRSQSSLNEDNIMDADDITPKSSITKIGSHYSKANKASIINNNGNDLLLSDGEDEEEEDYSKSELLSIRSSMSSTQKALKPLNHHHHHHHRHHGHDHDHDHDDIGKKLKEELCMYKQELKEYNETTKDLEQKYMQINFELSEMQHKHKLQFTKNRNLGASRGSRRSDTDTDTTNPCGSATSITSDMKPKTANGIYKAHNSFMTVLGSRPSNADIKEREFLMYHKPQGNLDKYGKDFGKRSPIKPITSSTKSSSSSTTKRRVRVRRSTANQENNPPIDNALKDVYNVLKDVISIKQQKGSHDGDDLDIKELYTTISSLRNEQAQYRYIIKQQRDAISDYHSRCVKAQEIMQTQKNEIEKLNINNKHLETSIYNDIDELRAKIDEKLQNVNHLPKLMREERLKYEKAMRDNNVMAEKLHCLQTEAVQLKVKIDDLGRRKLVTINRLKAAERDLKIFKNYNAALKTEKRHLSDELTKVKQQLDALQSVNKRQMTRHRDQSEKQRRDLQKRIFDLELKLSRSQNSTTSLIQERDSLIAELQTQLHTLVHNFEVSQKHIRVLRRHIYSMTTGNTTNGIVGGTGGGGVGGGGVGGGLNTSSLGTINNGSSSNKVPCRGSSSSRISANGRPKMSQMQIKT